MPPLQTVLLWRILAVIWAVKIFWLSTQSFSGATSGSLLARMLELLNLNLSDGAFGLLHSITRKVAHLVEYGVFSILLYRSFARTNQLAWQPQPAFWAVTGAAIYSLLDELHQALVPGRGASIIDCGIDTVGATLGIVLLYLTCLLSKRPVPKSAPLSA